MRFDIDAVKAAAAGRWGDLLVSIGEFSPDILNGRHWPCPKCGGDDRFNAMKDVAQTGGVRCNQCFDKKNGDGLAAIQWRTGRPFGDVLQAVAEAVGVKPKLTKKTAGTDKHLEFLEWSEMTAKLWSLKKPGIQYEALLLAGVKLAKYRKQYRVLVLPIWDGPPGEGKPVGYAMYDTGVGGLPIFDKTGAIVEHVKIKTISGSKPGWMGFVPPECHLVVKTEGPSDMLAVLSIAPPGVAVVCNAMGAKENPAKNPWIATVFAGRQAWVIHDADKPGQEGAANWSQAIARHAAECRNLTLPYVVTESHGKDVRDWLSEGHGWGDLENLAREATPIEAEAEPEPQADEDDDDPHRLARVNLERYATYRNGATIRYWRGEWYTWKRERGCYRKITDAELRAKMIASIKAEFDRLNIEAKAEKKRDTKGARKVTSSLVTNTIHAMSSMVLVPDSVEPDTWLDERGQRTQPGYIAMRNGLLDVNRLLAGERDHHYPHSANWFSFTCRNYDYDPEARCPKWQQMLEQNMEGDRERIALLQEWAGYLISGSTEQQKFMVLEGEGANGKSVFLAGLEAMLGRKSCSHVPLEVFGDRFAKTATLGKLLNISADCGELNRVAEGFLKSFTSGDEMQFDRKNLAPIDCLPTARLMVATNNRPRFSDKSDGIWRRMLLVPFLRQVPQHERILGMDRVRWWEESGELPGVFNWAIAGLYRLREQGKFTIPAICAEAMADYRIEVNPAREFLLQFYTESTREEIPTDEIYDAYAKWCQKNGYRQLADRGFGREILRAFKNVRKIKIQRCGERKNYYTGMAKITIDSDANF